MSATPLFSQEQPTYDPNATAESLGLEPYVLPDDFYPNYPWDWMPVERLPHETFESSLLSTAECGYNLVGFVFPENLPLCERLGLKTFVPVKGGNCWGAITDEEWKALTDEEIDERIRTIVADTKDYACVVGYYLVDEPGTKSFPALAKAVAAVKKYAPGKIAYINLFPSHATVDTDDNPNSQLQTRTFTEYLERFVQEVKPQYLSYDSYMVEYSDDMQDPGRAAFYYADLLEVRRVALKYDLPFWHIVSCNRLANIYETMTPPPSPARFAFQAYTTLAAGGRGLGWFIYHGRESALGIPDGASYSPIDSRGLRTVQWQYQQVINTHVNTLGPMMNRLTPIGVYFTTPTPVPGLPELPGKLIRKVESTASPRGYIQKTPAFMVGEFVDPDGNEYVMMVNLSLEHSARFHMETVKDDEDYVCFEKISPIDGSRSLLITDVFGEWVLPGHGILLKLNAKASAEKSNTPSEPRR